MTVITLITRHSVILVQAHAITGEEDSKDQTGKGKKGPRGKVCFADKAYARMTQGHSTCALSPSSLIYTKMSGMYYMIRHILSVAICNFSTYPSYLQETVCVRVGACVCRCSTRAEPETLPSSEEGSHVRVARVPQRRSQTAAHCTPSWSPASTECCAFLNSISQIMQNV